MGFPRGSGVRKDRYKWRAAPLGMLQKPSHPRTSTPCIRNNNYTQCNRTQFVEILSQSDKVMLEISIES
eukprot:1159865-Amphidinium_carterae.1